MAETAAIVPADSARAARPHDAMTENLIASGTITSAVVEAAFQTVPRHAFVPPGIPLEHAYNPGKWCASRRTPTARRCCRSARRSCRPG